MYTFFRFLICHLSAPKEVTVQIVGHNSVAVSIVSPDENPAIYHFEARAKGGTEEQACTTPIISGPLECTIGNLLRATSVTIEVTACVPGVCSLPKETTTPPSRRCFLSSTALLIRRKT